MRRSRIAWEVGLALLAMTLTAILYLGVTWKQLGVLGLPLDDAWIHQVYARNLAHAGCWSYSGDSLSTGSTAPAWTILLALGHLLSIPPVVWAYALGGLCHALTGVLTYRLVLAWFGQPRLALLAAWAALFEYHLAWAAFSGMETPLFVALCTGYLLVVTRGDPHPLTAGLVGGWAILTRPEAVILVAVSLVYLVWRHPSWRRPSSLLGFGLVLMAFVGPMVGYNLAVSGRPFPSTLYAKRVQWIGPWTVGKALKFLADSLRYFWLGPLLLVFPFAAVAVIRAGLDRCWELLVAAGWVVGLVAGYAVVLPVFYDRGRYLMALWPVLIGLGFGALWEWAHAATWRRLRRTYLALSLLAVLAFWSNGARAFALHVRGIESQHIHVAAWLREHTSPDVLVATHDVGVLGYFSERRILDLAGLVSPEVVPLMREPMQLGNYIVSHGVDYLAVFPSYYSEIVTAYDMEEVYVSDAYDFTALGRDPLVVYRVP